MSSTPTLSLLLALAVAACGGGPNTRTNPQGSDYKSVAARSDPRTNDPTAAAPAATLPPPGTQAPVTGAAPADPPPAEPTATTTTTQAPADAAPPKKISARHVLVQWMGADRAPASVVRSKDQALAVAQEVHRRAKAGDDFPRLAVEYSDEPGAGNRGGALGRFGRGQMVPQFEAVAFKLRVGEVSDIVETGFGYHVIQRTE